MDAVAEPGHARAVVPPARWAEAVGAWLALQPARNGPEIATAWRPLAGDGWRKCLKADDEPGEGAVAVLRTEPMTKLVLALELRAGREKAPVPVPVPPGGLARVEAGRVTHWASARPLFGGGGDGVENPRALYRHMTVSQLKTLHGHNHVDMMDTLS